MERNPLRVLDCKQQGCQSYLVQAPKMVDHLCLPCEEHFSKVRRYLEQFDITYIINPRLVRGLDYYTRTAFEVISKRLGAQDAIAGGGRYDGLLELLGGNPTPAIGFGAGMERLIYALERHGIEVPQRQHLAVFVISVGEAARQEAEQIVTRLRAAGIASDLDHIASTKLKNQLTKAIRLGARYAAIIGDDELAQDTVVLRDLADASQESLARGSLVEVLRQRLDNSNLC
jgi:histidyl-tRNA synthetase